MPGDTEEVPKEATDMEWYAQFFLTTRVGGKRPRAGLLHFDVDVRPYKTVHYAAAGTSTIIHIAKPAGGQEDLF